MLNPERSFFEAESAKLPSKLNSSIKIKKEHLYGLSKEPIPMDTIWSVNRNFTDTKILPAETAFKQRKKLSAFDQDIQQRGIHAQSI